MKKPVGRNIKILRDLCLIAIVSLGLLTIVGSGSVETASDTSTSDTSTTDTTTSGDGTGSDCNLSLSVSETSSFNPTYFWTGGDVMLLNVFRKYDSSSPVWQIITSDSNGISSSITHGTVPSGATEGFDTETSLSADTEYQVIIYKEDTSCYDYADFTTSSTSATFQKIVGTWTILEVCYSEGIGCSDVSSDSWTWTFNSDGTYSKPFVVGPGTGTWSLSSDETTITTQSDETGTVPLEGEIVEITTSSFKLQFLDGGFFYNMVR